jgi:hypothetical protein
MCQYNDEYKSRLTFFFFSDCTFQVHHGGATGGAIVGERVAAHEVEFCPQSQTKLQRPCHVGVAVVGCVSSLFMHQ